MGLLERARGVVDSVFRREVSVADERHWLAVLAEKYGLGSSREALSVSAVFACVRVIAETIASIPLMVYERLPDGGKRIAADHPLYHLLHDSPNPLQTRFEFVELICAHLCLRGNAYVHVLRGGDGEIAALVPLNPDAMRVEVDGTMDDPQISYYYRRRDGGEVLLAQEEMWHLRGISSDGIVGMSPVKVASETIRLALEAQTHGLRYFRNGAQTTGIASYPGRLRPDKKRELRDWLQQSIGGENKFRLILLEEGLTYQPVTLSNEDAQYLQTRQFQVEEIARIFRVPCVMIGHADKTATYASAEQFFLAFAQHTIRPWCSRIEQSAYVSLFERDPRYFPEFRIDALMRGDTKSRYDAYASALQNKWMTRNEVRALENLNPVQGGDVFENPAITPGGSNGDT